MHKLLLKKEVNFICPACRNANNPHKANGLCDNCYRRSRRDKLSTEEKERHNNQLLTWHAEGDKV